MSIATEIARLQTAKADIKTAIESKGVTVPSNASIDTYDTYVSQIKTPYNLNTYSYICQLSFKTFSTWLIKFVYFIYKFIPNFLI